MTDQPGHFLSLTLGQRMDVRRRYFGFLKRVKDRLAADGYFKSAATISRTWQGEFRIPNARVVAALQAEYLTVLASEATIIVAEGGEAPKRDAAPVSPIIGRYLLLHPERAESGAQAEEQGPTRRKKMKTLDEREQAQFWLRQRMQRQQGLAEGRPGGNGGSRGVTEIYLTLGEAAEILAISTSSMRKIAIQEPGVLVLDATAKRTMLRIPISVLERIIDRRTIRARS
jgi:hypothetical protein